MFSSAPVSLPRAVVQRLVVQALQVTLSDASYDAAKVAPWTNTVIDTVLKGLVALGRPFKYIGGLCQRVPRRTRQ